MKNLKIASLLFLTLFFIKCGKDKPVLQENELDYPLSFVIDHYSYDDATKFYVVGENNTYTEIMVSDAYKTSFDDENAMHTDEVLNFFELRKLVLKSATEMEATYADIDPNTYVLKSDTVVSHPINIDGSKINVTDLRAFFLSDDNKSLLLRHSVYRRNTVYIVDFVDNLDRDFSSVANTVAAQVAVQDTFGVKFFDLVYKKE